MAITNGGEVRWIITADSAQFTQTMNNASSAAKSFGDYLDSTATRGVNNFNSSLSTLGSSIGRIGWGAATAGAIGISSALTGLAVSGISTGSTMQSLQIQMNGLTKSTELGNRAMAIAKDFWENNPFQRTDVTGATKQLLAYGMTVDSLNDSLKILGNISIVTGVDIQALSSIFGRVSAQGKLMLGDIRQLTDNGVAILPALQAEFGKTADEVQKMATDGEISFEQFRKAMASLVDESIVDQLSNTLPRQIDRLRGLVSTLGFAFVGASVDAQTGVTAMERGILQGVINITKSINDAFRNANLTEAIELFGASLFPIFEGIANFIPKLVEPISNFFIMLSNLGPALIPILALVLLKFGSIASSIPVIGQLLAPVTDAFSGFGQAVSSSLDVAGGSLGYFITRISSLSGVVASGITTFANFTGSIISSLGTFAQFSPLVNKVADGIGLIGTAVGALSPQLVSLGVGVNNVATRISEFGVNASTSIQNFGNSLMSVDDAWEQVGSAIITTGENIYASITTSFSNAGDSISNFGNRVSGIGSGFNEAGLKVAQFSGQLFGFGSTMNTVGETIGRVIAGLATPFDFVGGKINEFGGVVRSLGTTVASGFNNAFDRAGLAVFELGERFPVVNTAVNRFGEIITKAGRLVQPAFSGVSKVVSGVGNAITKLGLDTLGLEGSFENASEKVRGFANGAVQVADKALRGLSTAFSVAGQGAQAFGRGLATTISGIGKIGGALGSAVIKVGQLTARFTAGIVAVGGFIGAMQQFGGGDVLNGLDKSLLNISNRILSFNSRVSSIGQGLRDAIPGITSTITNVFPALIASVSSVVETLGSVIATAFPQIAKAVVDLAPQLMQSVTFLIVQVANTIATTLPVILESLTQIFMSIVSAITESLPEITVAVVGVIMAITESMATQLPLILNAALELFMGIVEALSKIVPELVNALVTLINEIVNFLVTNADTLVNAAITLFEGILSAIDKIVPAVIDGVAKLLVALAKSFENPATRQRIITAIQNTLQAVITTLTNNIEPIITAIISIMEGIIQIIADPNTLGLIINGIIDIILAIAMAFINNIETIINAIITLVLAIVEALTNKDTIAKLIDATIQIVLALAEAIINNLEPLLNAVIEVVIALAEALIENIDKVLEAMLIIIVALARVIVESIPKIVTAIFNLMGRLVGAIVEKGPEAIGAIWNIVTQIPGKIGEIIGSVVKAGADLVRGLWQGIKDMTGWVINKIRGFGDSVLNGLKDFFGIHSPSREMAWVGEMLGAGLGEGIEDSTADVVNAAEKMSEAIQEAFSDINDISASPDITMTNPEVGEVTPLNGSVYYDQQAYDPFGQTSSYQGYDTIRQLSPRREVIIEQQNNIYTDVDMNEINSSLSWELNKQGI